MKRTKRKYENLYTDFKKLFPCDADFFVQKEQEYHLDGTDGMHYYFGFVVVPYLVEQLKNSNSDKLRQIFSFFEEMANSDDISITEVLNFSFLENILDNDELYRKAKVYFAAKTQENADDLISFGRSIQKQEENR